MGSVCSYNLHNRTCQCERDFWTHAPTIVTDRIGWRFTVTFKLESRYKYKPMRCSCKLLRHNSVAYLHTRINFLQSVCSSMVQVYHLKSISMAQNTTHLSSCTSFSAIGYGIIRHVPIYIL